MIIIIIIVQSSSLNNINQEPTHKHSVQRSQWESQRSETRVRKRYSNSSKLSEKGWVEISRTNLLLFLYFLRFKYTFEFILQYIKLQIQTSKFKRKKEREKKPMNDKDEPKFDRFDWRWWWNWVWWMIKAPKRGLTVQNVRFACEAVSWWWRWSGELASVRSHRSLTIDRSSWYIIHLDLLHLQ